MSYFDKHDLQRESYKNTLNLTKYFSNSIKGLYFEDDEYVALWHNHNITSATEKSQLLVEVRFVNLTNPIYYQDNAEHQSFVLIQLPINLLHKIVFGSIWKSGKSRERFIVNQYSVIINQDSENLNIKSFAFAFYNAEILPFEYDQYFHLNDEAICRRDKNQLLNIRQDNVNFLVHPLQFFMAHYGYSGEIKRILTTYNWSEVEKKLNLNKIADVNVERYVVLPRNFSQKDAIFLYHLKYDNYTKSIVKKLNNEIILSKGQNKGYKIPCWHTQPIMLTLYGISLGDSVLCVRITGISQPQGEPINIVLEPKKEVKKDEVSNFQGFQYKTAVKKYEREYEFDELDISLNPVNNLVTTSVIEQLICLGNSRQLNKIQDTQAYSYNPNTICLPYIEPTDFSVGDKTGLGNTGIVNCFYDAPNDEIHDRASRINKVWEHATRLRDERGAKVYWYTPLRGFNSSDKFVLVSLRDMCQLLEKKYPIEALVIRVDIQNQIFFVIDFPENKNNSGFSGIVYKVHNIDEFLDNTNVTGDNGSDNLIKLFTEIVQLDSVNHDYVDSKKGRMATFMHKEAKKTENNWVWRGINKLF